MGKTAGEILKAAREGKKWTQEFLAGKLGITIRQYNKYEANQFPKFKSQGIKELDRLLGTNLHELIYEQDVPHETGNAKDAQLTGSTVSLQDYIDDLRKDKALLSTLLDTNLKALMQLLTALSHHDRAWHETILRSLARLEKKRPDQLIAEARMSEASKTVEALNMDTGSIANK